MLEKGRLLTSELRRLQNLQEHDIYIARVFNVMSIRERDISHVSLSIIECPRGIRSGEGSQSSVTSDEEIPFVAVSMPVNLTHGTRLDGYERNAEIRGYWECGRV